MEFDKINTKMGKFVITENDALQEIGALKNIANQVGGVDSENNAIDIIVHKMTVGEITPAEAITEARVLLASRQDKYSL